MPVESTKTVPTGTFPPEFADSLGVFVKLMRAAKAITTRLEHHLACDNLTLTQLGVLEALLHKGPLSQRDLGRKVLTSAGNMTDLIDKLEARGLVRRTRTPLDRRSVRVELTQSGQTLIEELFPRHAAEIAASMNALNREELRNLSALLRKLGLTAAGEEAAPALVDAIPPP